MKQLHREWVRAGSDVVTTFTFYSSDDKLELGDKSVRDNFSVSKPWPIVLFSGQTCALT